MMYILNRTDYAERGTLMMYVLNRTDYAERGTLMMYILNEQITRKEER